MGRVRAADSGPATPSLAGPDCLSSERSGPVLSTVTERYNSRLSPTSCRVRQSDAAAARAAVCRRACGHPSTMALETPTQETDGVTALLSNPRFELMPFESFGDQMAHLPDGAKIAITTSPSLGLEKTIEWSERAAAEGYELSPHLAARYVEDTDQLDEVAGRLVEAGVDDLFVPGGDRDDPGEFESAYELLVALEELGYEFDEVGITGYPEGHDFLAQETLETAMDRKAPYATYIVTQLCFDPNAVLEWTEEIRDRGIDLPVEVGIPGVMEYQRLVGVARKVGVGDSIDFVRKTTGIFGFVRELLGSRGNYEPDALVDGLAPHVGDSTYDLRGLHIYTMNEVPSTEQWRRDRLGR
jgi:methylenetetrahydrofolate reductase (NADPH)